MHMYLHIHVLTFGTGHPFIFVTKLHSALFTKCPLPTVIGLFAVFDFVTVTWQLMDFTHRILLADEVNNNKNRIKN